MDLNMDDIELRLLAGMPIDVERAGKIYAPKLKEIIEIGESKYNQYLSVALFDKNSVEDVIDDPSLTNFDLVFLHCYHSDQFRNMYFESAEFIFKKKMQMCDVNNHAKAFFYFEDGGIVDKDNFGYIQEVVRIGNHIQKSKVKDDFNPANEQAKKFMEKLMNFRKSANIKKKEEITLHSMINGISWKSNNVNIFNIFDLTVYQLREGFFSLMNIDDYQYTLHGIYTGTIDVGKIKFDRMQWAKTIEKK